MTRTKTPVFVVTAGAIAVVLVVMIFLACSGFGKKAMFAGRSRTYHYTIPEKTDDGWKTASMESENFDTNLICELFERINDHTYQNIHSLLLVRNGKLVVEEYFSGLDFDGKHRTFNRDTLHTQMSVTKSVNSVLVGIAIDQHLIRGVDEKISAFFPEFSGGNKDKVLLKHFLSMTAGLEWDEDTLAYEDPRNDAYRLNHSRNPVQFVLEKPIVVTPGTKFVYNSGIAITLGEILHKASGMPVDKFAESKLFAPLGISSFSWRGKFHNGVVHAGGGLFLRPRDMAKIGFLFLNGGRWQGKQIVNEEWVRASTKPQATGQEYGYQWWLHSFRIGKQVVASYRADGYGGQFIFVFPDLNLVAVFTGWNPGKEEQTMNLLQRYILPAAKSD